MSMIRSFFLQIEIVKIDKNLLESEEKIKWK